MQPTHQNQCACYKPKRNPLRLPQHMSFVMRGHLKVLNIPFDQKKASTFGGRDSQSDLFLQSQNKTQNAYRKVKSSWVDVLGGFIGEFRYESRFRKQLLCHSGIYTFVDTKALCRSGNISSDIATVSASFR